MNPELQWTIILKLTKGEGALSSYSHNPCYWQQGGTYGLICLKDWEPSGEERACPDIHRNLHPPGWPRGSVKQTKRAVSLNSVDLKKTKQYFFIPEENQERRGFSQSFGRSNRALTVWTSSRWAGRGQEWKVPRGCEREWANTSDLPPGLSELAGRNFCRAGRNAARILLCDCDSDCCAWPRLGTHRLKYSWTWMLAPGKPASSSAFHLFPRG